MARWIILAVVCSATTLIADDLPRINKDYRKRIEKYQAEFLSKVESANKESIRRLKLLKSAKERSRKFDEAREIQKRIDELSENPHGELLGLDDKAMARTVAKGTMSDKERKDRLEVRKTFLEFFAELLDEEYDDAYRRLDSKLRSGADKKVLLAHLKAVAANLQIHKVKSKNIDVDNIAFSEKREAAKVTAKYRDGMGNWHRDKDRHYLVRRHGKWYISNKDLLEDLF